MEVLSAEIFRCDFSELQLPPVLRSMLIFVFRKAWSSVIHFQDCSGLLRSPAKTGTLKMRDMKMQDWKMRHKPVGDGKCETGKCGTKMQDVKMQDWKMRHKAAGGGKCRNGKSGKRKV